MDNDLWNEAPVPVERPVTMPPLSSIIPRAFTLIVGTVLVAVGCYYAISVVAVGIRMAQHPEGIEANLISTAKMLQLEELQVTINDAKVPMGRVVAGLFLLPWYLVSALLAMGLVKLGSGMVLGELAARREALATMRVLLATLRTEIESVRRKPA